MKNVEKIDRYKVGNFILSLRTEKGLSQTQLGMILGVTNKAVSKWENGDNQPEAAMLYTLASIFGVEVDELLNGERKKTVDKTEVEKENMFLKLRLQEAEAKERRESRIFFLTTFYLLTVVLVYFALVWVAFSRLAHYNTPSLVLNFFIGLLVYITVPIILAAFITGIQCLLILVRRSNPVLIIIMLALLPITLAVLELVGFALLIPMLIKNKKKSFSEEETKKIEVEIKSLEDSLNSTDHTFIKKQMESLGQVTDNLAQLLLNHNINQTLKGYEIK